MENFFGCKNDTNGTLAWNQIERRNSKYLFPTLSHHTQLLTQIQTYWPLRPIFLPRQQARLMTITSAAATQRAVPGEKEEISILRPGEQMKCRLTSNVVEVVSEGRREGGEASLAVEFPFSWLLTTTRLLSETAGLRDLSFGLSSGGDILPLLPALDSTAVESPLNGVPGDVHTVVALSSVVLHPFHHVVLDGRVQVALQQESSDTGTNLL